VSTVYPPAETHTWSTCELAALIDRTVTVDFSGDRSERPLRVVDAGIGRFGQAWIEFSNGSSVAWNRDSEPVTITVEEA
jgi:hypothetical protein